MNFDDTPHSEADYFVSSDKKLLDHTFVATQLLGRLVQDELRSAELARGQVDVAADCELITPELLEPFLNDDVALVTLQVIHYRSGSRPDVKALTDLVRKHGGLVVWDASHAGGSIGIRSAGGTNTETSTVKLEPLDDRRSRSMSARGRRWNRRW